MDSSSENSFLWTDASNSDSDDSDLITSDVKMSNHNHNQNESEKDYKKKLHKQLFQEQADTPDTPTEYHKKSKKKKEENNRVTPRNDVAAKQEQTSPESVSNFDRQLEQKELENSLKRKQKKSKKDRQLSQAEEELETNTSSNEPEVKSKIQFSDEDSYLDRRVKQEELENSLKRKQKKSKKDRQLSQAEEELEANTSSNEPEVKSKKPLSEEVSYLDRQVKQKELDNSLKKKQKKSKKDRQSTLSESMNDNTVNGDAMQVDNEPVISKKRKRKSDSQSETGYFSDMVIVEKFEAEETIVQTPVNKAKKSEKSRKNKDETAAPTGESAAPAKKKRKLDNGAKLSLVPNSDDHTYSDDNDATALPKLSDRIRFEDDDSPLNTKTSEISQTKTDLSPNKNNSSPKKSKVNISTNLSVIRNSGSDSNDSDNSSIEQSTSNIKNSQTKAKSVPKLSDKIRFEDDEDLTMNAEEEYAENVNKHSYNMKCFLKANPNLKRIDYNVDHNSVITKDDEIWLLTCPQDMDIDTLKGNDLLLDSKCKVKINGNTFDGVFEEQSKSIGLLATYNNQVSIINLPLKAAINFRRRIPKAHFVQDSGMVNNQTNFNPLPSTKCRHPLFGPDYKKAIKIPTAVKARLAVDEEAPVKKKKKKSKRSEYEEQASEPPVIEPKVEKTKSKKRKHLDSNDQAPVTKKIKKVKHEPESNEVWESEKAIEKNLFNF